MEGIKTHILCQVTFFLNCAFYEINWKNIVQQVRSHVKIWLMHSACWILKATHIHLKYIILIVFHCNNGCKKVPRF